MKRPPTYAEAATRKLLEPHRHAAVHTFSNGSEWDSWSDSNCCDCRFYDPHAAGELCAFECAAFLHQVSPELAEMFGWLRAEGVNSYAAPEQCAFFQKRGRDDDGERPVPPPTDPRQLVLIADPTEDAAVIQNAPEPIEVPA